MSVMLQRVQLSEVSVRNLFGIFHHAISLRTGDRVTILHGPNGVGKTVVLRMIQAFFEERFETLLDINFEQLSIELTDGRCVEIRRVGGDSEVESARPFLEFRNMSVAEPVFAWSRDRSVDRRLADLIDSEVSEITQIGPDTWSHDFTGEVFSVSDLIRKYRHILPEKARSGIVEAPKWLQDIRSTISVHLVETQRLLNTDSAIDPRRIRVARSNVRSTFTSTVKSYSSNLERRLAAALAQYAEHSQALDRSFPQRMLGGTSTGTLDTSQLKIRMEKLEQRRTQLRQIGLIENDPSYPFDINTLDTATDTQKAVMTLYVVDTESKLGVLDDLETKVDLLQSNINRKFSPHKSLRADRNAGLLVRDRRGVKIDLESLSSGEQHELVLIYDLLFQVKAGSLVLIDEPELSLHVTWQKAFLKELLAIVEVVDFDVLLATHSPFIVGDRVDLMVPLALEESDYEDIQYNRHESVGQ